MQPHVAHHRTEKNTPVGRAKSQEPTNLLKVNSMKSLQNIRVSRQHLLSFMPMPVRVAPQPFQETDSPPRMPDGMKVAKRR